MATRLSKVPEGGAIVVAAVALARLQLAGHIAETFSADELIPQVGQGALGIECRIDDERTRALLAAIEHPLSRRRVDAERAFLVELGGDCELPAGAHAVPLDIPGTPDQLRLRAFLATGGAPSMHTAHTAITGDDPAALGTQAARELRTALAS